MDPPPATSEVKTLLLVDDQPELLAVLSRGLTSLGFRVLTGGGGRAGLEILRATPVDLVVLDMVMPAMDGVETLRRIRAEFPAQPVVILSAFAPPEKVREVTALGIRAYLVKPMPLRQLAEALAQALASGPGPGSAPG